ncbi:hypothetical protein [Vogesella mureinivorans]|uniref:hypothetical protein n=1 Tax=Vogesella mureinivorans TaxID=657276 RepID=UPI0011C80C92|nr:hypothetical protein [Vogesella mureinivorans]
MSEDTKNFAGEISASWTAEQGVAFECARDYISYLIAIQSKLLARERAKPAPDADTITRLQQEQARLSDERRDLKVQDSIAIDRIRKEYGARLRAWHQQQAEQNS